MNAHYYTPQHYKLLPRILERLSKLEIDGLIITDLGLLFLIKKMQLTVKIIISGEAMGTNVETLDLYRNLGAKRIILPRQMTLRDLDKMTRYFKDLEFEAFIFADDCFFEGGVCNTIHHVSKNIFCEELLEKSRYYGPENKIEDLIKANLTLAYFSRMRKVVCGLCSLGALEACGVRYLKVAGRTAHLQDRLFHISIVKKALEFYKLYSQNESFVEKVIKMRNLTLERLTKLNRNTLYEFCMLGNSCYYPDDPILVKKRRKYFGKKKLSFIR